MTFLPVHRNRIQDPTCSSLPWIGYDVEAQSSWTDSRNGASTGWKASLGGCATSGWGRGARRLANNRPQRGGRRWKSTLMWCGDWSVGHSPVGGRVCRWFSCARSARWLGTFRIARRPTHAPRRCFRILPSVESDAELTFKRHVGNHIVIKRLVVFVDDHLVVSLADDLTDCQLFLGFDLPSVTPTEIIHRPERVQREEERIDGEATVNEVKGYTHAKM